MDSNSVLHKVEDSSLEEMVDFGWADDAGERLLVEIPDSSDEQPRAEGNYVVGVLLEAAVAGLEDAFQDYRVGLLDL